MRAFRPSRFAPADAYEEEHQRDKDANLQRYAKRAELGMPLFERLRTIAEMGSRTSDLAVRD
jgi:hypothetical protein